MWKYRQKTGELLDANGVVVGVGYSGIGDGRNNPAMQMVQGHGPIPVGTYSIGEAHSDPQLGPTVMRLTPDAGNEMFHRDDFFVHGDSLTHPGQASHGCIVIGPGVRLRVAGSPDKRLGVVTGA